MFPEIFMCYMSIHSIYHNLHKFEFSNLVLNHKFVFFRTLLLWLLAASTQSLCIQWLYVDFFIIIFFMILNVCPQAAKETGALQAAKNMLEKQVEELTWRLQLEKRMRVIISL